MKKESLGSLKVLSRTRYVSTLIISSHNIEGELYAGRVSSVGDAKEWDVGDV